MSGPISATISDAELAAHMAEQAGRILLQGPLATCRSISLPSAFRASGESAAIWSANSSGKPIVWAARRRA
jgi:hypothetical protein